ncbi:MAG: VWA domain-containing protein [Bacteroidetes bacterium]|nr:VWA domain-containing protein [Bacteroidota bacterium]MBS1942296.1 VWA domain-containing protein [Bacteroidota bacterium]
MERRMQLAGATVKVRMPIALVLCCLFTPCTLSAQNVEAAKLTRILFVMDCSNSMNAFWDKEPKIDAARAVLLKALPPIENAPNVELALRLYGHQSRIEPGKQDCDDTKLEVPFGPHNGDAIRNKMKAVRCLGTTPIARSLEKAASDFPDNKARNIIILITDGIEACDEDPCAVSRALQAKGIILKPFVIGIGIEDAGKYSLKCVGNYYDAGSPEMFDRVLKVVIDQALNATTTQLLLLTDQSKPTETDVPVTFYDQRTGEDRYDFVHTMNLRGEPDTLSIDPVFTYRIVAHTVPPSVKENVIIEPGVHNVIALVAGQGRLELKIEGAVTAEQPVACIVRKHGETATVNAQLMNSSQLYRTGSYDLEVLTLPRLYIPDVVIKQSGVTPVSIPRSGVVNVVAQSTGPGAIFKKNGNELEWVVDLDTRLDHNQFKLLPGDYRVIYRRMDARETAFSIVKDFTVASGRAVSVEL